MKRSVRKEKGVRWQNCVESFSYTLLILAMCVEIENYVVVLSQNENKFLNNSAVSLENVRSKHRDLQLNDFLHPPINFRIVKILGGSSKEKKAIKVHNKSWRTRYRLAYGRNNGLSQWLSVLYSDTD